MVTLESGSRNRWPPETPLFETACHIPMPPLVGNRDSNSLLTGERKSQALADQVHSSKVVKLFTCVTQYSKASAVWARTKEKDVGSSIRLGRYSP